MLTSITENLYHPLLPIFLFILIGLGLIAIEKRRKQGQRKGELLLFKDYSPEPNKPSETAPLSESRSTTVEHIWK